jgi:PPOX class probable F420-dependent enzyme
MDPTIAGFIDQIPAGVLGTVRKDGRARLSTVYYVRDGDRLLISTESKRGKARDVERTGHASLCVQGAEKPFPFATLEGSARILRENIGEPTSRIVARIIGAPPGEAQTDEALAAVDRVILEIDVERTYSSYIETKAD